MKAFCKKIFGYALFALLIMIGYKFYIRAKSVMKLNKTLPDYLKNIFGEKPRMNLSRAFRSLEIDLVFSKEALAKDDNIEETVIEYIEDFYPGLSSYNMNINIEAEEEPETEDIPEAKEETEEEKSE